MKSNLKKALVEEGQYDYANACGYYQELLYEIREALKERRENGLIVPREIEELLEE